MNINEYKKLYDDIKTSEETDNKILNSVATSGNKHSRSRLVKVASIALACIVLSSGSAYAINYVLHMDSHVKKTVIRTTEKSSHEQYLIKNGYDTIYTDSKSSSIKCSDNGISVQLLETIADKNIAYVYFKVDYGKWIKKIKSMGYKLSDVAMEPDFYSIDSNGNKTALSWATCSDIQYKVGSASNTYGFFIDNEKELDLKNISMEIKSFTVTGDKAYSEEIPFTKGNWKISWNLKHGNKEIRKTFNREINLGKKYKNTKICVKDIIISPISYTIYYTYPDNSKDSCQLADINDGINKGAVKINIGGIETDPVVEKSMDAPISFDDEIMKYTAYTGVIGNIDDITSITLPEGNVFDMTK